MVEDKADDQINSTDKSGKSNSSPNQHQESLSLLSQSEALYRSLLNSIDEDFCVIELIYNQQGNITDLIFRQQNQSFNRHTGLGNVVGKTVQQVLPQVEAYWIDICTQVAQTGKSIRVENYVQDVDRWYSAYFSLISELSSPFVAVAFQDVTARRRAEVALQANEERFRLFVTASSDVIYRMSADWRQMNQLEGKTFLADTRQPSRDWLLKYISVEDRGLVETAIEEAIAAKRVFELEHRVIQADGQVGWTYSRAVPILDDQDQILEWLGTASDITDRKRYEQQQAYLLTLSDALRSIADPVIIEEVVTQIALKQFGADRCYYCRIEAGNAIVLRDAMRGGLPSVAGNYPLSSFTLLKQVVDAGRPFVVDDTATTPILDDTIRALCLQLGIISFLNIPVIKHGKAVGVLCIVQSAPRRWTEDDIRLAIETAERTWAAVERAMAEEALYQADRRKNEFLAMLAHELRNPLAPIRNGLELLAQIPTDDPTLSLLLPIMNRQMNHLVHMVDDLLDVSRIVQGKIKLHQERIDLVQVVSQALDAMRPLYATASRQLTAQLPNYSLYLLGDATRLNQMVTNLLTNGLRYTGEGGQVWLSLEQADKQAMLRVSDNGIGLAADQLKVIFDLFVQVDNSLARSNDGLGLGLTLVKQLVEQHGGRVEARSAGLGQGSEFVVCLPLLMTEKVTEHD